MNLPLNLPRTTCRSLIPVLIASFAITMPPATAQTAGVWHQQTPVPAGSANSVDLISSIEGWAASTTGVGVLHTAGGVTWAIQSTP